MLHLKKVLAAKPKEHVVSQMHPLLTPWGETHDPAHVLDQHPTPQFRRASYHVLNGRWKCAFMRYGHKPTDYLPEVVCNAHQPDADEFSQDIVVPFSPETLLSGVGRQLQPDELLWYRLVFNDIAHSETERVLLHFQAVDYVCAVRVNDQLVDFHVGGYTPFYFDVTDYLYDGENELCVCVVDPSEFGQQPRGKQRLDRGDIWCSAQSGIWQSVWAEVVPANYIAAARIQAGISFDADGAIGQLAVRFQLEGAKEAHEERVLVEVLDGGEVVASADCLAEPACSVVLDVPGVVPWSPETPRLYDLRFTFGADTVDSYCAFRSVAIQTDEVGHARLYLNERPFFIRGVLDQGYWSDGLLSAPSDEALIFDIETMRSAGFNTLRMHVKVEAQRWYYHCDRLGMLVWQDMVSGGAPELNDWNFSYKPTLFRRSWNHFGDTSVRHQKVLGAADENYRQEWLQTCAEVVELLGGHPCVVVWNLFNEGWGQFNSEQAYNKVRSLDATRPICAASGWYDQGVGDICSVHNYFRDFAVWKRGLKGRAFFIAECGGFAYHVDAHSALDEVYGYEIYNTQEQWYEHTRALLDKLDSLEQDGLAGFIVTQLSDIEEESNGILTFDRRVNKLMPPTAP